MTGEGRSMEFESFENITTMRSKTDGASTEV